MNSRATTNATAIIAAGYQRLDGNYPFRVQCEKFHTLVQSTTQTTSIKRITCEEAGCPGWLPQTDLDFMLRVLREDGYETSLDSRGTRSAMNIISRAGDGAQLIESGEGPDETSAVLDAITRLVQHEKLHSTYTVPPYYT